MFQAKAIAAGQVFTPTTPVDEQSLFAGREKQLRRVVDAINQRGQHAIIFGERGVGKTSLGNVLASHISHPALAILAPRVNCDTTDTFESVWRKVLDQIEMQKSKPAGLTKVISTPYSSSDLAGNVITPDGVRRALTIVSQSSLPILIIDEFDRLSSEPRIAIADTIKSLSDHDVRATVVLVGVADSVDKLVTDHQSVERALVQVPMPRMSVLEIEEIITTGVNRLGMTIDRDALKRISMLAQGLPHYAHLIGLHASREALDAGSLTITLHAVKAAITRAIEDAQQSIRNAYMTAIRSARKDNLFSDVLLACALASKDQIQTFAAQDVRMPMRRITGKDYDIPNFAQHLAEFSDEKRGNILEKIGQTRRFRFRFANPLMQPYVIMNGFLCNRVPQDLFGTAA
jgi:Cdc6-like AAA superfamily ATPase